MHWSARRHWPSARRALSATAAGLLTALSAGCGLVGSSNAFQPDNITVTSPELTHGAIPARYTCRGAGLSPPLHWSDPQPGTKSLALVVDDAATPISPYIYWVVFDINPATTDIQPGRLPPGARQARGSAGHAAYDPPCPRNPGHSYRFTVYALGSALSLPDGAGMKTAWMAIAHASIARGRLTVIANP